MTEELGGNITLVGFSELDGATKEVVRKMVGHWTQKETSARWGFQVNSSGQTICFSMVADYLGFGCGRGMAPKKQNPFL